MQITLSFDTFTELPYTSGTIQNISSQATVEICQDDTVNSGLILGPGEWFSWSNSTIYARSAWEYEPMARCAVVPFKKDEEGGEYILPAASKSTLGGVKVGNGLSVAADGTLSATGGTSIDEWTAGNTYAVGDFVTHQNLLYKCITANSDSTWTPANWQKIGDVAFTGATTSANGTNGLVPLPTTSDVSKFLCGDGTWKSAGGSGANAIKDVLWEGQAYTLGQTLTLTHNYSDYDYIYVNILNTINNCVQSTVLSVDEVMSHDGMVVWISDSTTTSSRVCCSLNFSNNTASLIAVENMASYLYLSKIEGIKFVNPNVYSTTEQRIGTWIDGKPLYQVTVTGTTPSTAGEEAEISLVDLGATYNVKQVVDISGYLLNSNGACWSINSGIGYTAYVRMSGAKNLVVWAISDALSLPIFVTVKYTKTTD